MADHLWFVPVTGGWPTQPTGAPPGVYEPREINVQWNVTSYPTSPPADIPCVRAAPNVMFTPASSGAPGAPAKLNQCYGSWRWRSCTDGQVITVGGQLEVGTVLSRFLPVFAAIPPMPGMDPVVGSPSTWNTVEAWVKYRVSATGPLSAIVFTLNDSAGAWLSLLPAPFDWLPSTAAGAWRVIYVRSPVGFEWPEWVNTNLRAVLTVLGTTAPANVGPVTVDVEWFAFRLSDQMA